MITLTIILLLIFIPASRRILADFASGILSLLGLAFLVTRATAAEGAINLACDPMLQNWT